MNSTSRPTPSTTPSSGGRLFAAQLDKSPTKYHHLAYLVVPLRLILPKARSSALCLLPLLPGLPPPLHRSPIMERPPKLLLQLTLILPNILLLMLANLP